jgi:hypothetical protein
MSRQQAINHILRRLADLDVGRGTEWTKEDRRAVLCLLTVAGFAKYEKRKGASANAGS